MHNIYVNIYKYRFLLIQYYSKYKHKRNLETLIFVFHFLGLVFPSLDGEVCCFIFHLISIIG